MYWDPWQGHSKLLPDEFDTVHPSCVHTAVSTVNALDEVRAIRNVPIDVDVVAIEPLFASGDVEPIGIDTTRPATVPLTDASGVPDDGDVGLPPQAASEPSASSEAAVQAPLQNSLREEVISLSMAMPLSLQES